MKLWTVAPIDKDRASAIQNEYNLPAIIAMLLQIRGITSKEEIEDFLYNDSKISSPFEIKDMDKAAQRIKFAVDNYELICVYGDYDADGVTSTALMYSYLDAAGANAMYYIPSRETEGYGMNKPAIDALHDKGVKLIVTVDNGITAIDEIDYAKSLGIDTVVTDHHTANDKLPNACAVVDPHRKDCKSKFKNLSGVGVAFKTVMALEGEYCDVDSLLDNYSDLVCLGTIGDIVELMDENRVFVKRGLKSIMNTDRAGIDALVKNSGLNENKITAGSVSYMLIPRINAVGRLGLSQKSVSLLLTEDYNTANEISSQLCGDNLERKKIEKKILSKIEDKIKENPLITADRIIVIDGENWHQGVIGIVASHIKEIYGKPTIIISRIGENAKGSGRSIEGFSLCDAVFSCSDIIEHCGGHPMAAGLTLKSENIDLFRKRINEYAYNIDTFPFNRLKIDCKLNPAGINVDVAKSISYLEPFGAGNSTPIFGLYNMTLKQVVPLSNNKHLKLVFTRNNSKIEAVKFFTSSYQFPYNTGDVVDLAVTLDKNTFNGRLSVSVVIKNIKASSIDTEQCLNSLRNFEDLCLGKQLKQEQIDDLMPNRSDFVLLYKFLRPFGVYKLPVETLVHKLDNKLSFGKIKVILQALSELGLVKVIEGFESTQIMISKITGKVDINSAPIIKKLRGCHGE